LFRRGQNKFLLWHFFPASLTRHSFLVDDVILLPHGNNRYATWQRKNFRQVESPSIFAKLELAPSTV
jgi:hypothetical protein